MSDARSRVLQLFKLATGRPVRWASDVPALPFEGREFTLDIFDVVDHEQRALFHQLAATREEAAALLGHELRVIFHTPEATTRHYPEVREEHSDAAAP